MFARETAEVIALAYIGTDVLFNFIQAAIPRDRKGAADYVSHLPTLHCHAGDHRDRQLLGPIG
jgi:hypothetical protein